MAEPRDIEALMIEGTLVDEAVARAVWEAVSRHKRLGQSIAIWRDGRVVWLKPEEIPDPPGEGRRGRKAVRRAAGRRRLPRGR